MTTKVKKVCGNCGSENVYLDGSLKWSIATQSWELNHAHDESSSDCSDCDSSGNIVDAPVTEEVPLDPAPIDLPASMVEIILKNPRQPFSYRLDVYADEQGEVHFTSDSLIKEPTEGMTDAHLIRCLEAYFNDTIKQLGKLCIKDYGNLNEIAMELTRRSKK